MSDLFGEAGSLPVERLDALVQRCRENLRAGRGLLDGLSAEEICAVHTRYAAFEDILDADEFLVASEVMLKTPRTPRPFVHILSTNHDGIFEQWASFWDQHGGGFSALDSVMAGRMTSHLDTNYVPTSPEPQDVRNFYVHENGRAWPMFPTRAPSTSSSSSKATPN